MDSATTPLGTFHSVCALSIPLNGFSEIKLVTGSNNYTFNSIEWIPRSVAKESGPISKQLSIPLNGFTGGYDIGQGQGVRDSFNSIEWILGVDLVSACSGDFQSFNSIEWIRGWSPWG